MNFFILGKKINHLFPIQSETFDYIYDGKDLIAQASKFVIEKCSHVSHDCYKFSCSSVFTIKAHIFL